MNRCTSWVLRLAWVLVLISALLEAREAASEEGPPPVLDKKTYHAPAGDFSLTVDPSDRHGAGGASYRLHEGKTERWTATLPFTLWEAGVTDGGIVGGYAYTRGPSGWGNTGDLIVVILDPDGKIRLKEATQREESRFLHMPSNPIANGLVFDQPNDRMVIRVADADVNRGHEAWWVYRLLTGKKVEVLTPAELMDNREPARSILAAKPIAGTPLTLLHWWRFEWNKDLYTVGARFTLVDLKAKPVWSLDLPTDYEVRGDDKAQDKILDLMRQRGGILQSDQREHFDLFFAAESKRVTFAVKQSSPANWTVTEIARVPHEFAASNAAKLPSTVEKQLEYLGPLALAVPQNAATSPFHDVHAFVYDDKGRIAFIRKGDAGEAKFVLADQAGKLLREIPLKVVPKSDSGWKTCWAGASRFIVANSASGIEGKSRAWSVNADSGELKEFAGFDCPHVGRLVGFADGSFVALATMHYKFTLETSIIGFDSRGQQTWTLKDDFNIKGPNSVFGVEDIARTTRDEIVVLENIRQKVKWFDRKGRFQREIDLKIAWGREPNYPTAITPDIGGGFFIEDFNGSPPYVRMNSEGKVRAGITPKYLDGRLVDAHDLQASPNGRLWTCDGESVIRLTHEGVVDLVLGEAPQTDRLGKIAGMAVDRTGKIYAVDSRTGSIHVFDAEGKPLHICRTLPADFRKGIWQPTISVNDRAEVYLGLGDELATGNDTRKFAHFSETGKRIEELSLPDRQCYVQGATGNFVAMQYEQVRIIDKTGKELHSIRRRPDGNWLAYPHAVALAADGSMAILALSHSESEWVPPTVNMYSAGGDPIRTIPLPDAVGGFPRIAYGDNRIVIVGDSGVIFYDASGKALQTSAPPQNADPKEAYWSPFLVNGGRELLLLDHKTSILHRYAMP